MQFGLVAGLPPVSAQENPSPAPEFALVDLRGRERRLTDYRGKVVLLNFWATWCPPCRAEMPDLIRFQRRYGARGLQVIGVDFPDDERRSVRRWVKKIGVNYPILWGTPEAAQAFEVADTLPVTVVIDRQGMIRERIVGILLPEEFAAKVKPLLAEAAGEGKEAGPVAPGGRARGRSGWKQ